MGTVNTVNSNKPRFRLQSILKMRSFKFLVFLLLIATVSSASLNSLLDEEGGEVVAKEEDDDEEYEYEYYGDGDYDYDYGEEDDEEENLEEDLEEEQEDDLEEEDLE